MLLVLDELERAQESCDQNKKGRRDQNTAQPHQSIPRTRAQITQSEKNTHKITPKQIPPGIQTPFFSTKTKRTLNLHENPQKNW